MTEPRPPAETQPPIVEGYDFPHEIAGQLTRRLAAERDYVDGQVAVIEQRLDGMDEATRVLSNQVNEFPTDVDVAVGHLKELTEEKFRGVGSILDEQRRAIEVAEEEREKAAQALRQELSRAIEEGDRNLRDHISAQVAQIQAALLSASELAEARLSAVQREAGLIHEASQAAIAKAEAATNKQLESVRQVGAAEHADAEKRLKALEDRVNALL